MTELSLPMSDPDQRDLEGARLVKGTLLFSVFTYVVLTAGSSLLPYGIDLLSGVRLLTTFVAAAFYFVALRLTMRVRPTDTAHQLRVLFSVTAAATVTLLASRLAFDVATDDVPHTLRQELLLVVIWVGYFAAWLLGSLFLFYRAHSDAAAPLLNESHADDPAKELEHSLWIETNRYTVKVPVRTILWIEAEGNYVRVHHEQGSGLIRLPLARLQEDLRNGGMVRVHRSALCQRRHVRAFTRRTNGGMCLLLSNGTEVPVGRKYASAVGELIKNVA